jgi:hypothetical protein
MEPSPRANLPRSFPAKTFWLRDGNANYFSDGSYQWQQTGNNWKGKWYFQGDQVCVNFDGGKSRCDRYGKSGDSYFLINGSGKKFNVLKVTAN